MLKDVKFIAGFFYGMIIPAVVWLVFGWLLREKGVLEKPAIPYLIAIAGNLIILRYLAKRDMEVTGYGIVASTFIIAILVFKFIKL